VTRPAADAHELVITRFFPMTIARRGVEMRLVIEGNRAHAPRADSALLKAVARARQWSEDLLMGRAQSVTEIAERQGVTDRYVRRLMRLAFLAPRIVEAIIAGNQPPELTAEALAERIELLSFGPRKNKRSASASPLASITSAPFWPSTSANRSCRASGMDGTASLAHRDFGRIMSASGPEMGFSGAAQHANKAAGAGYFADSSRESADLGTRWRSEIDSNSRATS
jgi:hypothetical protein